VCCFVCYLLGLARPLCFCLFFFVCPWCVLCESVVVAIHDAMHEIKRGLIECFFDVFEVLLCMLSWVVFGLSFEKLYSVFFCGSKSGM